MPKRQKRNKRQEINVKKGKIKSLLVAIYYFLLPKRKWLRRTLLIFIALLIFWVSAMYGIARWYIARHASQPTVMGITFIPDYARSFGLNPEDTMQAMIDELGVKHVRLVSYWEDIEREPGVYDFSELDWQFAKAEASGVKVSLALGLRQPRWPECHSPLWANVQSNNQDQWYPQLKKVTQKIVERYKGSPMLVSYQLENEYFLKVFGECKNFNRERLIDEYNFVKSLDTEHKVIVSRSNNAIGFPMGQPTPNEFGVSVYKRVWDKTVTKRYIEYPFPAWFYGFLAGAGELLTGKDMIIHELQAEPWAPTNIHLATNEELAKSLDAKRLHDRFEYGKATGIKTIYLWGAEYWYYQKVKVGDASLWNVAKDEFYNTH